MNKTKKKINYNISIYNRNRLKKTLEDLESMSEEMADLITYNQELGNRILASKWELHSILESIGEQE